MKRFHLHVSVQNPDESIRFYSTLFAAQPAVRQSDYTKSDKHWVTDPTGMAWESFHTLGSIPVYGEDTQIFNDDASAVAVQSPAVSEALCCVPAAKMAAPKATNCCG